MKLFCFLISGLLFSLPRMVGQTGAAEADNLYNACRFGAALPLYLEQLKQDPENAGLNYKTGICYLESRSQKHKAADYLEKAVKNSVSFYTHGFAKENDAPILAYRKLGEAYELDHRFDLAIDAYEKYKDALTTAKNKAPELTEETDKKIERCKYGKELKATNALPENFNPARFKESYKSKGGGDFSPGEYSAALSADKSAMIYTFIIPLDKLQKKNDSKYFENTPIAPGTDTLFAKQAVTKISKKSKDHDTIINIATVGASVDGQVLLTYKDEKGDAGLYVSRLRGNKWSVPQKLPKTTNDKGWEPNEFVTADGNYLYFVSNRPGGYGGKDIYRCKKLPDGEWSRAANLGPVINTAYDDEAPFLHPDGATFYFSSNRGNPLNSFDIYTSVLSDSTGWNKPAIVGYPINSSDDDVFYQVASNKKKIYASTTNTPPLPGNPELHEENQKDVKKSKKDSLKKTESAEKDNYIITFRNQARSPLTLLKGEVRDADEKTNVYAEISVRDNETGKLLGVYYPDPKTGEYLLILPAGKNNNVTYEARDYLFYSENIPINPSLDYFEKHVMIKMQRLQEGSKVALNNVFFENDRPVLLPTSYTELNRLYSFLKANPGLKIKLSNSIYTKENTKHHKQLSEERAKAVLTYLTEKGIDKDRLAAKGSRKSELPGGKKKNEREKKHEDKIIQVLELEIDELEKPKI